MPNPETDFSLLLDAVARGNCVPFVGMAGTGSVPDTRAMTERLAAELSHPTPGARLSQVMEQYEVEHGKMALILRLKDWLNDLTLQPGPLHHFLAQLPFTLYLTTAPHHLLEQALADAKRPVTTIVRQEQLQYFDARRTTVVKLWGDIAEPESLVLAHDEHVTLLDRLPGLSNFIVSTLATRTVCFLDYDLADEEIQRLLYLAAFGEAQHKRSAYAVWPQPDASRRRLWEKHNLRFIDSSPEVFLCDLHRELDRRQNPPQPQTTPASRPALARRPYRFLDAYTAGEADFFAGRQAETEALAQKILAHRLVILTGISGSGKTSLLQAGVGPRLAAEGWRTVFIRGLGDPLAVLQRALEPTDGSLPQEGDLRDLVLAAEAATQERLIVVLDQFEEFFLRLGSQAQTAFIAQLAPCLTDPRVDTRFVLSLRDDFFLQVSALEAQIPGIFHNIFVLQRLTRKQALAAVLEPLKAVGYEMEPGLADRIISTLDRQGVDPPQLQIVCDRLYDAVLGSGRQCITASDYERLGGIEKVLPAYLSDVLARLPQAKVILEALVGDRGLNAARTLTEISARIGDQATNLLDILQKLVAERLVRAWREGEIVYYELTHDVLAAAVWTWLAEGAKEAARARGILERGLSDWVSSQALFDAQRLDFIAERWPFLGVVASETQALLLRSALRLGHDIPRWLERVTDPALDRQVLLDLASHPEPATRVRAISCLPRLPGIAHEDDTGLAVLRSAAVFDGDEGVRQTAAVALYTVQNDAATHYLAARAVSGDPAARRGATGSLAVLGDAGKPIWSHLDIGLRARVMVAVARIRMARHWPQWGVRAAAGAAAGAIGFALAFTLNALLDPTARAFPILVGATALPFGAIAGLFGGLGIGAAAALADRDIPWACGAGGALGFGLGYAVGLQGWYAVKQVPLPQAFWPMGLVVGALTGLGLGLALGLRRPRWAPLAGAFGATLGMAVIALLQWFPEVWSLPLHLSALWGVSVGAFMGCGFIAAESRH